MLDPTCREEGRHDMDIKNWQLIHREDGRVEVACPHGIGHISRLLTPTWLWKRWMGIHGCDGCCLQLEWEEAERVYDQERQLLGMEG